MTPREVPLPSSPSPEDAAPTTTASPAPASPAATASLDAASPAATSTDPAIPEPMSVPVESVPVEAFDQPTAAYDLAFATAIDLTSSEAQGVAGEVAVDLARQLGEPVRALRDRLGLVVDHLERHVATSTGPTPYPWRSLQALRQDLAAAYLEATTLARRLDELHRALDDDPPTWFDLAAAVELGLHIAGHHLAGGIELLIDLGNTPPARGTPGTVALLVAQLVAVSAKSARDLPGSTVSVRVIPDGDWALLTIADNGAGSPRTANLGELVRVVMTPWGGTIDAASVPGAGCTFELRLAIGPR
jgi:signal transduction histidine kinase